MKIRINKTKIIATYGPACSDLSTMEEMVRNGLDVFRFNMSHGTHEEHIAGYKKVRQINLAHGLNIAILADLQGPKIRIGEVRDNGGVGEGS
jgi:pyruvate kinase